MDRAEVIEGAAQYWTGREAPALLSRMSFEAGDLLEAVPAATGDKDIYLLSAVLHGFDDDTCVKALDKLATASAGTGARIALMEMVLPESRPDLAGASFDMQMFMGTCGRERTLAEWQGLFDRCGLLLEEVVSLRSIGNILVLSPK